MEAIRIFVRNNAQAVIDKIDTLPNKEQFIETLKWVENMKNEVARKLAACEEQNADKDLTFKTGVQLQVEKCKKFVATHTQNNPLQNLQVIAVNMNIPTK